MMKLSKIIVDSKSKKTKRKKDKEDCDGPSASSSGASGGNDDVDSNNQPGSSGASGGNDDVDSKSQLNSGHTKRDVSCDKKASELVRLTLAHMKIDNQLFEQQQPLRVRITSSPGKSTEELPQREEIERRRSSLPSNSPREQRPRALRHQTSEPLLSQMNQNRQLNLADPLSTSVLNNLELLEELGKSLDKEYKCGELKCWKHLSEHFGVEAKTYEDFTRSQEHSPTEDLFEYLKTRQPDEFTVGKLKDKLSCTDRSDVQGVLLQFDDETQVGNLFESHPHVIAQITFLLDKEEKPGKRNWKYLADMFGVPRSESENFGESIHENPTKQLFQYLRVKRPRLTTGELKELLWTLKMQVVLTVLAESKKVEDNSPLKDLWEDPEIAARVCNLLNKKHTSRIRCWRLLGNKLGVKEDTLDTFSNEGEVISPTEVLINHLGATRPSLVMADLIWALESIGRPDALSVVEAFLPDGHVSSFLDNARTKFWVSPAADNATPH